jgi:hypothetical protein
MKTPFALFSMIFLLSGCDKNDPVGRYEIHDGTFVVMNANDTNGADANIHAMIKLDTKTGDSWIYLSAVGTISNETKLTEGWHPIKTIK